VPEIGIDGYLKRHCEPTGPREARLDARLGEAIPSVSAERPWIASSLAPRSNDGCSRHHPSPVSSWRRPGPLPLAYIVFRHGGPSLPQQYPVGVMGLRQNDTEYVAHCFRFTRDDGTSGTAKV
jgi:hypothetical protein